MNGRMKNLPATNDTSRAPLRPGGASQNISRGPARHERSPRSTAPCAPCPGGAPEENPATPIAHLPNFLSMPLQGTPAWVSSFRGPRSFLAGPRLNSFGVPPGPTPRPSRASNETAVASPNNATLLSTARPSAVAFGPCHTAPSRAPLRPGGASQNISRGPARHERSPRSTAPYTPCPGGAPEENPATPATARPILLSMPLQGTPPWPAPFRGPRSSLACPRLIPCGVPPGQNHLVRTFNNQPLRKTLWVPPT